MDVLTPAETETRLSAALQALEEASLAAQHAETTLAEAEAAWKVARSQAILVSQLSSQDKREAEAIHSYGAEFHGYVVAKGAVEGHRLRVAALRQSITGLSSLNASARALGGGTW